jgi:geranylgeranyl diphosphate synthase type 3
MASLEPSPQILSSSDISIPPRTSSHQRTSSQQTFQDASGNTISPSSPPTRGSSLNKRPISASVEQASLKSQGKQPVRASERPKSSHFPASESVSRENSVLKSPALSSKAYTRSPPRSKPIPMAMDAYAPPPVADGLIHHKQPPWSPAKEKILLGPYDYLFGHPGKDIRATLISAFNAWLQVPERSLTVITKVVGMLHTASLLYDLYTPSSPTPNR